VTSFPTVDQERLEALLGGPDLAWLRARVRSRLEAGRGVTGTATLRHPRPDQREAVERLLGRRPAAGTTLTVPLAEVDRLLRGAGVCAGLATAVVALDGPVHDRRARRAQEEAAWNDAFAEAHRACHDHPWASVWLDELVATGLARRLAQDPAEGAQLLRAATDVLASLPAVGLGREQLAATVLSDSHALDDDRAVTTLVLKALQHRNDLGTASGPLPSGEERRLLWATAGVLLGGLARPALALGLRAAGRGLSDRLLVACADEGEPVRLTLRQLLRHPPDLSGLARRRVFVCENPAVVAAAADQLGVGSAPLVCVEGQPASAVQTLLRHLAAAGADLCYHGDFDWAGVQIAGLVFDRFQAGPWRFDSSSYASSPAGPPLRGNPMATPWDPDLADRMVHRGVAVHEEQILDRLLDDLAHLSAPV